MERERGQLEHSARPVASSYSGTFHSERDFLLGNSFQAAGNVYINARSERQDDNAMPSSGSAILGERLLKALSFPEMDIRQDHIASIVDEFGMTCQWIVTPGKDYGFMDWCEHGNGIFWINGLPGTGKSTLMDFLARYIRDDDSLLLSKCFPSSSVQLLKFFFYLSKDSTKLQNSFEGLWRSLCFQVLHGNVSLLREVLDDTSAPASMKKVLSVLKLELACSWSSRDLKECFKYLVKKSNREFFCLLDGLDEFEEDQSELLQAIHDLVHMGLRLCCASRPDEPFRTVLRPCASIMLQDVNAKDIHDFCSRKLINSRAVHLVNTIVSMSEGIFLWAAIVTLDIRRAAYFADEAELLERLDHYPTGVLTNLYKHMVERQLNDTYYRQNPSPYLRIVRKILVPPDTSVTSYINPNILDVLAISSVLSNMPAGIAAPLNEQETIELNRRSRYIENQVLASCAGFVHIKPLPNFDFDEQNDKGQWDALRKTVSMQLAFVHKTAREFLDNDPTGRQFLYEYAIDDDILALAICKACAVIISLSASIFRDFDEAIDHGLSLLAIWAPQLEQTGQPGFRTMLYETVSKILKLAGQMAVRGTSPEKVKDRVSGRRFTPTYHHDLSFHDNFTYKWIGRHLDIVSFFRWCKPSLTDIQAAGALLIVDQLPQRLLQPGRLTTMLASSIGDIRVPHTISQDLKSFKLEWHTEVSFEHDGEYEPVRVRSSAPIWSYYIAGCLRRKNFRGFSVEARPFGPTVEALWETALWFVRSGASLSDQIHLTVIVLYSTRGPLRYMAIFPYVNYDQIDLNSLGNKHVVAAFELSLPPFAILPSELLEKIGYEKETSKQWTATRVISCSLLKFGKRFTLAPVYSTVLCEAILTDDHRYFTAAAKFVRVAYEVLCELLATNRKTMQVGEAESIDRQLKMVDERDVLH